MKVFEDINEYQDYCLHQIALAGLMEHFDKLFLRASLYRDQINRKEFAQSYFEMIYPMLTLDHKCFKI